ncbi:hypothetical protein BDZ91DRAFT_729578 [Kalaharituber pfeilii]|nr:hypothetical protein BDZ91DRAFT_729578 [Kalaharituber pfeilii]
MLLVSIHGTTTLPKRVSLELQVTPTHIHSRDRETSPEPTQRQTKAFQDQPNERKVRSATASARKLAIALQTR